MRWAPGRISRGLILLLTVGALLPTRAPAQTKLELHGGDRLRLTREVGGPQHVFWLRDLRGDTLIVSRKRDSAAFAFAPGDLHGLETLVPRSIGQGALHRAAAGILIGGVVGFVTGAFVGSGPGCGGRQGDEMCFDFGPVGTAVLFTPLGWAAGGIIGTVAGLIDPGNGWAEVKPPIRVDFRPGPAFPPTAAHWTWDIGLGPFIVMDDKWEVGFQQSLSLRRGSRRNFEWGVALSCDFWHPALTAPEGSAVKWESSGAAWLFGVAPTVRFLTAEPRDAGPRLFLEATAGAQAIVSNAKMLKYEHYYDPPPEVVKLMGASFGMLADVGIGVSYQTSGVKPELAIKLHGVVGKAETASTFMLELGVGF